MLEGAVRPGHFAGVLTVVAKLFGLVAPDVALFGEKDYQQLTLIRRWPASSRSRVEVVGVPTVREDDGLALSSRNRFLDAGQRATAGALSAALRAVPRPARGAPTPCWRRPARCWPRSPALLLDYLELTDPDLGPAPVAGSARLLVAARAGTTRLIDNAPVTLGDLR